MLNQSIRKKPRLVKTNYRPVSLLPHISKVFERCMHRQISEFFETVLSNLSKAFDCLPHDLIVAKLDAYGFSTESLKLINSYLTERKQRVKMNDQFSSWLDISVGVPQGSILGPLLFNIFLCDMFLFCNDIDFASYADNNTPYCIWKTLVRKK